MPDIVITLVLLGILVTLSLTTVDSSAWNLDAASNQVAQHLRIARQLAVMRQHDVIVEFDIPNATVSVHEDRNSDGARDDGERVRRFALDNGALFTGGSAPAYAGFTDGPVTFGDGRVKFRRNGSASEEGAIYVGRRADDEHPVVIVLGRATGFTQTFKHTSSGWKLYE
jgi:Tfp pilus assembly protein FimT